MHSRIWVRRFPYLVFLLVCALSAAAVSQNEEKSHRERFADRRAGREIAERNATEKILADPGNVQALIDRGVARLGLGRTAEAEADFRRATELDPNSADAFANLAYVFWLGGQIPEALSTAESALAINPDHASAHYYTGRIMLQTGGDQNAALEHISRAANANPGDVDLRFDLLASYRKAGDLVNARIQFRFLRALVPSEDQRLLYAEGLLATDMGHFELGIARFRDAVKLNPGKVSVRQDLGVALAKVGRWSEAIEVLAPLAQERPQSFPIVYFHALSLQNDGRVDAAETEVRRAISLNAGSADAHALLGIILAGRGEYKASVGALRRAAELQPSNFDAQFFLGRTQYALREYPAALEAFRLAVGIRPDDADARFFYATALEMQGQPEQARAQYRELAERIPDDLRGHVGLGNLLAKYGEVEAASESLGRARELDPENFEVALTYGRILRREGKLEEAIAELKAAVALRPESPDAHNQLGLALRRAGRDEEAAAQFALVEEINRRRRDEDTGMNGSQTPPGSSN